MKSLSEFVTEASVSAGNLEKAVSIFRRVLEREFGTTLYRYGGESGVVQLRSGIGILFLYRGHRAVRFNYAEGHINSVSVWTDYKLGVEPQYTIDLGGMNLLQSGKLLVDLIRKPILGKFSTYPDLSESILILDENYLTEAKRATPENFYQMIDDNLMPHEDITKMPWQRIVDIARSNDTLIPYIIQNTATKGPNGKLYDVTKLTTVANKDKPVDKNVPQYFIKVTKQEADKKFSSVKNDPVANAMLQTIQNAIDNPTPQILTREMKSPATLFSRMRSLVQVVGRGARNALLIYGNGGTGKTFVVTKTLEEEGLVRNKDWYVVKGKITTASLYQNFFIHRHPGEILVFDDADSVWQGDDSANILKAALDSYDTRVISWYSARTINVSTMSDEEKEAFNDNVDLKIKTDPASVKFPSEFVYEGRVIFISNMAREKFDDAVLTRCAKIDMTLTQEQMFTRMEEILPNLGDSTVPIETKKEILEFLRHENKSGALSSVSMRTFGAACDLYKSGIPDWKDLLEYV